MKPGHHRARRGTHTFPIFLISSLSIFATCSSDEGGTDGAAALLLAALQSQATTSTACPPESLPPDVLLADTVESAPAASANDFKDPQKAVNGICGAGQSVGSGDVYELGPSGADATLVLSWANQRVTNASGIDIVIFENVFQNSGQSAFFVEPVIAEVSDDNANWCGWAPDYTNGDESAYSGDRSLWQKFAGLTPTLYNMTTNPLTTDQIFTDADSNGYMDLAGGDGLDLDDLSAANASHSGSGCSASEVAAIQSGGFIYLRLTNAGAQTNPDTAANFPVDETAVGRGPDIDGVVARSTAAR